MPVGCVSALLLTLLAYGAVRYQQLSRDDGSVPRITAGVAQANISQYARLAAELGTFDAVRRIVDTHFALSAEALRHGPLDVLVWPETVYPTTFGSPKSEAGAAFDQEIGAFVDDTGVPLVFGAYDAAGGDEFNAAILLEPAADGRRTFATYRKASLFPLTEHIPAVFDSAFVRRMLPWLGTWKPGKSPPVLPLHLRDGRTLRIAPLICYDALDPNRTIAAVRQGAELIVTLSNDSWFAYGNVPRLILIISAFRSLETRRPQVRAANTGISAVITPTGEFLDTVAMDARGTLVRAVTPVRDVTTLMLRWGDWFGPTALVAGAALLAAPLAFRQLVSTPPSGRP
jgi:apolipoprotein N-acyltransferase